MFRWFQDRPYRRQVEKHLTKTYGSAIALDPPQFIRGHPGVCRFALRKGSSVLGQSIIVKKLLGDADIGEMQRYPELAYLYCNDRTGLQFLNQMSPGICPQLYTADDKQGFMVMEYLNDSQRVLPGPGNSLQHQDLVVEWGMLLGKLHAGTRGKQLIYDAMRDELAPRQPNHVAWGWVRSLDREAAHYHSLQEHLPADMQRMGFQSFRWMSFELAQATSALQLSFSEQARTELEIARQALSDPGPFLAYTHGDPWSSDWLMTDNGAKLVDFENGDYRHAFIDLVHPRMGFPTQPYSNVQSLPQSSLALIEQAYRAELSKGCSEVSDQQRFRKEIVHACTYWALMACRFRSIPRFIVNPASIQHIDIDRQLVHFEAFARQP
jgi:hypothetical protein